MQFISKNKGGFSLVEVVIVIGIILVLLGVGQYIYKNRQKSSQPDSSNTTQQSQPQANSSPQQADSGIVEWKQATLGREKIKLKYPSTWNYLDNSTTNQDKVKLSGGGISLDITTGNEQISGFCASCKLIKAEPATVLGQAVFLNFISTVSAKDPNKIQLSFNDACAGTCGIEGKNILVGGAKTIITTEVYYQKPNKELETKSLSSYQSDQNYLIAKEIIKSFSY